jgi:predicted AAA+ superfamily ATPase
LSTIKNYIDYFQNVFLLYQVGRFDYSIKKQKVSSSKIYVNDTSFLKTVSFNFSENTGKRLENFVFLQLRRRYDEPGNPGIPKT